MGRKRGNDDFRKVADLIREIGYSQAEAEEKRRIYIARRDAYNASEKGMAEAAARAIKQAEYREKEARLVKEMETLNEELPALIDELLDKVEEEIKTLSVEEILKKHKEEIDLIESKSDRLVELIKRKRPTLKFSYYTKLFHELSEINVEFIMHTPVKVFFGNPKLDSSETLFNIKGLSNEQLDCLYERLKREDASIFKDKQFKKHYSKHFVGEINNLETISDVRVCLARYPEAFPILDNSVKVNLFKKNELSWLISKAPNIVLYMTMDEVEELATKFPKLIATACMGCPDVLDILDEDFFERHDYRLIFTNYSKDEMKATFGAKVKRHRRLENYLNKHENRLYDPSLSFEL